MKNLLVNKNVRLLSIAAAIALIACVVYAVQSTLENALFFLVPLGLVLGILSTIAYILKPRFSPLPSALCYSAALGGYLSSMLTNVVNTHVHMAHYNLASFYTLVVMMALCCIAGITACFVCDI